MKFAALALDYDGTIAEQDVLHPEVRAAIGELRRQGIVVVLVTGRRLRDLKRVAGDLSLFDAVVAENGAVLEIAGMGRHFVLSQPLAPEFVRAVRRLGIDLAVGECIGETDAVHAPEVVAAIRDMQLPLVMLFNRSRVMILAQGVSKATGLHAALRLLRLSEHNVLAIGDAENDHPLLQACELGVVVSWGSPALKAIADAVLPGAGPGDVAGYLRQAVGQIRLPAAQIGRHRLQLGHIARGGPVTLAVRNRNVLIAGDSCTGKSWVAGLLCEQLVLQHYSVCVIDPEGDYRALTSLPGVINLGGQRLPPGMGEVSLALRHPDLSVVIDLSQVDHGDKQPYVESLLAHLRELRRRTGLPHRIVVDEAHYYLRGPQARPLLDPMLDGYTLVTYHPSQLDPEIRAGSDLIVLTRLTDPQDLRAVRDMSGDPEDFDAWKEALSQLRVGQAGLISLCEPSGAELQCLDLEPRLTDHVRHRQKYVDVPVPEWESFIFTRHGRPTGRIARTVREFAVAAREVPSEVLDGHLARRDISRWVRSVLADQTLAAQIEILERGHIYEALSDIRNALAALIEDRYALADPLL
jgi:hydroxymethylpyrimidine pyrophosphatase-like HAD family hydrolase